MIMKGLQFYALVLALVLAVNGLQAEAQRLKKTGVRGERSLQSAAPAVEIVATKGSGDKSAEGEGDLLDCFTNNISLLPVTTITLTVLLGCVPTLLTGGSTSLEDLLGCLGTAIGCDDEERDDLTPLPDNPNLGDLFDFLP